MATHSLVSVGKGQNLVDEVLYGLDYISINMYYI